MDLPLTHWKYLTVELFFAATWHGPRWMLCGYVGKDTPQITLPLYFELVDKMVTSVKPFKTEMSSL